MVCIYCASPTHVTNSRPLRRTNGVWRRRHCAQCGSVFTTNEAPDLTSSLMVEEKDGQLTPFMRVLLLTSIYDCCRHLSQPAIIADELANTVILELLSTKSAIVPKKVIISATQSVLSRFDHASGVQYQAFHKNSPE